MEPTPSVTKVERWMMPYCRQCGQGRIQFSTLIEDFAFANYIARHWTSQEWIWHCFSPWVPKSNLNNPRKLELYISKLERAWKLLSVDGKSIDLKHLRLNESLPRINQETNHLTTVFSDVKQWFILLKQSLRMLNKIMCIDI